MTAAPTSSEPSSTLRLLQRPTTGAFKMDRLRARRSLFLGRNSLNRSGTPLPRCAGCICPSIYEEGEEGGIWLAFHPRIFNRTHYRDGGELRDEGDCGDTARVGSGCNPAATAGCGCCVRPVDIHAEMRREGRVSDTVCLRSEPSVNKSVGRRERRRGGTPRERYVDYV